MNSLFEQIAAITKPDFKEVELEIFQCENCGCDVAEKNNTTNLCLACEILKENGHESN